MENCAKDCSAYNTFERVTSNHLLVSSRIRLTLRVNKNKKSCNTPYDWSSLKNDLHIAYSFTLQLKNRFDVVQEGNTENSFETTLSTTVCCLVKKLLWKQYH